MSTWPPTFAPRSTTSPLKVAPSLRNRLLPTVMLSAFTVFSKVEPFITTWPSTFAPLSTTSPLKVAPFAQEQVAADRHAVGAYGLLEGGAVHLTLRHRPSRR